MKKKYSPYVSHTTYQRNNELNIDMENETRPSCIDIAMVATKLIYTYNIISIAVEKKSKI